MREHHEALGLEQRCIEPGHWMIEGYEVIRPEPRIPYWKVYDVTKHLVHVAFSLRDVRYWIKEQQ